MSDFPCNPPTPTHINTWMKYTPSYMNRVVGGNTVPAQRTWVNNYALYVPLYLPFYYPLRRFVWVNGGTVTAASADVGVYTSDGTAVWRNGGTALAGASAAQYVATSDILLAPGMYYLAYSLSGTMSNRAFGTVMTAEQGRFEGLLQQASAYPLPATMTPAVADGTLFYQLMGITRTSTGY